MVILAKIMKNFIQNQISSGILLFSFAVLALIVANSDLATIYNNFLSFKLPINISALSIQKDMDVKLWIDDGLMAIFFLLVGLELKREVMVGELSSTSRIILPIFCAIGGVFFPVIFFFIINFGQVSNMPGIAIPAATDIAFAVALLSLFGNKISNSLRIFLVATAIIDDLIAILIIAIFYSADVQMGYIGLSALIMFLLLLLNIFGVFKLWPYLFLAPFLWLFVLKSGVHATVAGVLLALFIPIDARNIRGSSPLQYLEAKIHFPVSYLILPIFAFANTGINLSGFSFEVLSSQLVLGIALGLFLGKQFGVMFMAYLIYSLKLTGFFLKNKWGQFYGVSVATGIGFTMSLFINNLAFDNNDTLLNDAKIGIVFGSILSAVFACMVLWITTDDKKEDNPST
jgi:NhaA family Na+:H+ antiporter